MLWPERPDNWRLGAKPAQKAFAQVAENIARFEPVFVGVSSSQYSNARYLLNKNIRVVEISYNDSWIRDIGPTCVVNNQGKVRGVKWDFNAWGGLKDGLYFPWDDDCLVSEKVLEIEGLDMYVSDLVLEGGSIHVDGEGTLITTEECLLNPNRNPHFSKKQIEDILINYLNVSKIIWVKRGVYLDETSGHIDNLCCFVKPGVIALTWTNDENDPQYAISMEALCLLTNSTDAKGRKFKIHKILQPEPQFITKEESESLDYSPYTKHRCYGDRMPASYINFYIVNSAIILPVFRCKEDDLALNTLKELFDNREIIQIPSREILLGGGNIHCITQQIPK